MTIDNTKVSGTGSHSNFPVLISYTDADLKDTTNGGHVGQSDGGDILFTSSDGTTQLSHEIEKYDNTTGQLIAWVKVPTLSTSADTDIYVYYGNASSTDQWDPTNVWDSNYVLVQHMNGTSYTALDDSTSNNNDVTAETGDPTYGSTGKIGAAVDFDGNDYVSMADSASLSSFTSAMTIQFWAKPNQNYGMELFTSPMLIKR